MSIKCAMIAEAVSLMAATEQACRAMKSVDSVIVTMTPLTLTIILWGYERNNARPK